MHKKQKTLMCTRKTSRGLTGVDVLRSQEGERGSGNRFVPRLISRSQGREILWIRERMWDLVFRKGATSLRALSGLC